MSALFGVYTGVALVNLIMPTNNNAAGITDATVWAFRGSTLAGYAIANPGGKIRDAWDSTLDSASQGQGADCPDLGRNYTYGGGHGIQGCGAHISISMDSTDSYAAFDLDMTWYQAQVEGNESFGASYSRWWAHCNYDCNTYPFQK